MIELKLETKTKEQELVKQYLENNASEMLADKINNGVKIVKNDITLISKKDLDGFMKFASDEARKLAEKDANCACIEDKTVYGWAVHFFEEDSIEGKLYNLDGTEYKAPKTKVEKKTTPLTTPKKVESPKQPTLFDWFEDKEPEKADTYNEVLENDKELDNAINGQVEIDGEVINYEDFDGEPTEEEIDIASRFVAETEIVDKETGEIIDNELVATLKNLISDLEVRL